MAFVPSIVTRCPPFTVAWTLHVGASTYDLPVKSWSITRSRKDPLQWEATLPMTPALRRSGSIGQHLRAKGYFNASWALQKWIRCAITLVIGGTPQTWTSPKLVLKTRRTRVSKKERILSIGGIDRFEPLLEKDVVEDDVRSTEAAQVSIHEVIGESLEARGIDSYTIDFEDFPIRVFHRTGQPLSYLRDLWDVYQCNTQWVDDTLVITPGGTDPTGETADFALTEGVDAVVIDHQESDDDVINEATVERPRELKRATTEPVVGKGLGAISIPLSTPLTYAVARIKLFDPGRDAEWVWDDEAGNPLTGAPTRSYSGSTAAHTLRFNLYPPEGSSSTDDISYSVEIVGEESHEALGGYQAGTHHTASNSGAQDDMGPRRPDAPTTWQHIPNQTICQAAAEAQVVEELLNFETAQVDGPLLEFVDPGMTCALTSEDLDLAANNFRVQTVAYKQGAGKKDLMRTVGLGRGPT